MPAGGGGAERSARIGGATACATEACARAAPAAASRALVGATAAAPTTGPCAGLLVLQLLHGPEASNSVRYQSQIGDGMLSGRVF